MIAFGWLALVIVSLAVSLLAFIWALESGQFRDQERLRYQPLVDLPAIGEEGDHLTRKSDRYAGRALLVVIAAGIAVWLAPMVLLFFR